MHVYSVGELFLGLSAGGVGATLLVVNLLALTKGKKFKTYSDMKWFVSSLFYTACGVTWGSRAFDPPHQNSLRSDVIYCISIPILLVTLGILHFAKRRLPKDSTV